MTAHRYRYEMTGGGADGQTWKSTGTIDTTAAGAFPNVPAQAMRLAFEQLTQGKAEYGKPGVGCNGPYSIKRLLIEDITGEQT